MPFEYATLLINDKNQGKICDNEECNASCDIDKPVNVTSMKIDINDLCSDQSGKGIIKISFNDNPQVNDCNSYYEACINVGEEEHCCSRECEDETCERYVAFDCDTWQCIDLKDIMVKNVECEKNKCNVKIFRNVHKTNIKGTIIVYDENNGKIYYLGNFTLGAGSTGTKTANLRKVNECENKNLKIMLTFFKNNNIISRIQSGEFTC